ncbi:uncharacterized protein [Maniola hyperantus]|uniref:uncharacterized protein n=1 Tax=Aphantopus hyperantus TaxID=2795564 RepID=UPI00213C738C
MRLLMLFTTLALVDLLIAEPIFLRKEFEPYVVTPDFYKDEMVIYRGKYDIVKIVVLINSFKYDDAGDVNADVILFFVEADEQSNGTRQDKGLYVFKEGKATKILINGRDAAASGIDAKRIFFGAADGIYVYNETSNSADKYGPITDSIIAIASEQSGDIIYILTEDREVFKVSDNGEKKEKLDDVVNAKEIVLDKTDHLFFFSDDNKPYVRRASGVNPVVGLPKVLSNAKLIRPPFFLKDEVPFLADNKLFTISSYAFSTTAAIEFESQAKPTAFAPEVALIQYYGFNKKIYEFRLSSLHKDVTPEKLLGSYLDSKLFGLFGNRTYCFNK